MGLKPELVLALAKKYTRNSIEGVGAIKGEDGFSPIIVENVNNTEEVYKLDVLTASGTLTTPNLKGSKGETGATGANGFSPKITESADNTNTSYKLQINDAYNHYTTPNLIGPQGPQGERGEQGPQGERGEQGNAGVGIASGGTTGQVLAKRSEAENDTEWITIKTENIVTDATPTRGSTNPVQSGGVYNALTHHITDTANPHNVTALQVGAVPNSRTVNGIPLGADIVLSASDVGADTAGSAETAEVNSKAYTDHKVNIFHATLDDVSLQYVKGSADFTYEQVKNTENCIIEVSFADEKIFLIKQEHKNIDAPDPIAGRYIGFSNIIRVAYQMAELFMFVYDPENLPTDEASLEKLADWGDAQYCVSSYQPIVMGNFLDKDVTANRLNDINAPSTKATADYTDSQCGVVLDYMQTTFANNIMALCNDRFGPHIIYDDANGFEASNDHAGETWHLTGLDLSPYKRIKCYVCSGGNDDSNYSPEHIVEVYLDDRAKGSFGYFTADHAGHCPNNRNRHHMVTFTVNAEKTAIQFQHSISIYGTSASDSIGGRRCYLIEGYYI